MGMMGKWTCYFSVFAGLVGLLTPTIVDAAVPNSFILNEANSVSGGAFLDKGRSDATLGRVEGNGQNWIEFLVVQGDELSGSGYRNTLDLRGWKIEWSYDKRLSDPLDEQYGSGVIEFTDDPLWAAVPRGTMLTVSEWQDAWYLTDTPASVDPWMAGGLQREGGINGLGNQRGTAYNASIHTKLGATVEDPDPHVLYTDTSWNPAADDWNVHVFAGERNPDDSFKYFTFSGSITDGGSTFAIGTDDGGLFPVNNDNWQWTIKDASDQVIQGPYGEEDAGLGSTWRVGSDEIIKLEQVNAASNPTPADYLGVGISDYNDGSSVTFGNPNTWSSGAGNQGLDGLRDWLLPGDANLDGKVDAADYALWRRYAGGPGGWRQGDFDGSGMVDADDYEMWRSEFAAPAGAGSGALATSGSPAVAEPASWGLLALAAVGWAAVYRRRSRHHDV